MSLETSLSRDPSHLIHLLGGLEWSGLPGGSFFDLGGCLSLWSEMIPLLVTMAMPTEHKMIAMAVISMIR